MTTMEDWAIFLAKGKVTDDHGKKATGKGAIGTQLNLTHGKVKANHHRGRSLANKSNNLDDVGALNRMPPQLNWSLESDRVRLCVECLDPIPNGTQAVHDPDVWEHRRDFVPGWKTTRHVACVPATMWHKLLGNPGGADKTMRNEMARRWRKTT
jgi:hypothetical protein